MSAEGDDEPRLERERDEWKQAARQRSQCVKDLSEKLDEVRKELETSQCQYKELMDAATRFVTGCVVHTAIAHPCDAFVLLASLVHTSNDSSTPDIDCDHDGAKVDRCVKCSLDARS